MTEYPRSNRVSSVASQFPRTDGTTMASISRRKMLASAAAAGALTALSASADSAKPRIKIGQIGVGHAHATKLAVYRDSPDYEVVGIVEPDKDLRERAKEHSAVRDLPWLT